MLIDFDPEGDISDLPLKIRILVSFAIIARSIVDSKVVL